MISPARGYHPPRRGLRSQHRSRSSSATRFERSPASESHPLPPSSTEQGRFPYELVSELAELGLMGLPIPEEYGGAGGDTVSYAIAVEELTRIDSSVAITVAAHTSLGTMPILLYGDEEQKQRWLPDLASGRKLAAFGPTSPPRVGRGRYANDG